MAEGTTTTLNFEGFDDSTILTTQYSGVTFNNTIILTAGIGLNELQLPPHSGVNVASDNGGPIEIVFSSPITSFAGYFTYFDQLNITAFDASSSEIASTMSAYSDNDALYGDPGSSPNEYLSINYAGGIGSIMITGDPAGGSFVLDDAAYTSLPATTTPEPSCFVLAVLPIAVLVIARAYKRKAARSS
jgi:hypothetical protein